MGLTKAEAERLGIGHLHPGKAPKGDASHPKARGGRSLGIRLAPKEDGAMSWVIWMPGWIPVSLNRLLYRHWASASRAKRAAMAAVVAACVDCRVPAATGRRRVSIVVGLPDRRHRPDVDNLPKAVLDGLTACGALVDDSDDWCEQTAVRIAYGVDKGTTITLEEIG